MELETNKSKSKKKTPPKKPIAKKKTTKKEPVREFKRPKHEESESYFDETPEENLSSGFEGLFQRSFERENSFEDDGNDTHFDSNDDGGLGIDEDEIDDSVDMQSDLPADIDVFDYVNRICRKKGDLPKYRIYKNGELLTTKIGEANYDKIQAEFGGGHYKVYGYFNLTGKYIKGQSRFVAEPLNKKKEVDESEDQAHELNRQGFNVADLIKSIESLVSKNTQKEVEAIKSQNESKTTEMSLIMQMMVQQSQMQMQALQKQNNDTMKMFELMIQMQNSNTKKKDDNISTLELIKLLESSKQKGASEFKELFALAKELAEDMGGDSGESKEKDDLVTTLVKTLGPVLAQAATQAQVQNQHPSQAKAPSVLHSTANEAEALRKNPLPPPPARIEEKKEVIPPKENFELGHLDLDEEEAEDAQEFNDEGEAELNKGEEYVESKEEYIELPGKGEVYIEEDHMSVSKERLIEILTPDLITGYLQRKPVKLIANMALDTIKKNEIPPDQVLKAFPNADSIINAAKEKGVPESFTPILKEFYANLKSLINLESHKGGEQRA